MYDTNRDTIELIESKQLQSKLPVQILAKRLIYIFRMIHARFTRTRMKLYVYNY